MRGTECRRLALRARPPGTPGRNKGLAVKRTAGMNRRPGVANEDAGWEYWRALAEEARTCAAQMREPAAQRILQDISVAYATLAQRAKAETAESHRR
jgi:hypothetical protein